MDHAKIRRWQVDFAIHRAFSSLPIPTVVVEEIQEKPLYRMNGRCRGDLGCQMVITIKGRGEINIDDKVEQLTPGKAFLHNHMDKSVCYYYPRNGSEPWIFLWIAFLGDNASSCVAEINQKYGYIFDAPVNGELYNKLMNYKPYKGELQLLTPLEGASLFYDCIAILCDSYERKMRASSPSAMVVEIQQLINDHIAEDLHIETLAKNFKISREHLSRTFHEQTSMTLQEYITRTRLKMAIGLLHQTRLSIKEISDKCGWSEYAIFYRTIKKRFGVTPNELRASGFRPQI